MIMSKPFRIGIDARFYGPAVGGGLGRYVGELIAALEDLDHTYEYVIFLKKENYDQYVPRAHNFRKVLADIHWYSLREAALFPRLIAREHIDLMHFTHFNVPLWYTAPFVVTVHDLILPKYSRLRSLIHAPAYFAKLAAYHLIIAHALADAQKVIAVSHATAEEITRMYGTAAGCVAVIPEGYALRTTSASQPIKSDLLRNFILYVGSAYPHKNLTNAIRGFEQFRKQGNEFADWQFVLVGKPDFFYARLQQWVAAEHIPNIIFYGFAGDAELADLYRRARLCMTASREEGLGLPVLEALALGCRIACSAIPAFQEIVGASYPYLFDPLDPADIGATLARLARADTYLIDQNIFTRYSWENAARATRDLYVSVQETLV